MRFAARFGNEFARTGNAMTHWYLKLRAMKQRRIVRLPAIAATVVLVCLAVVSFLTNTVGQAKRRTKPSQAHSATPAELPVPFQVGEKLEYRIRWSTFLVNAATVRLTVNERRPFYGREAWHFQALAHTIDTMRLVFELDDQFDSYSEPLTLGGHQYEMYLREQGRKENVIYRMSTGNDPAPGIGTAVKVLPGTRDPIGFLHYLRTVDWQATREVRSPVFDGKKLYEVQAHLVTESGPAEVPAGKFTASRIEIRVSERGKEVGQTRFWVWLSRDARRTPVLIEVELPFGSGRVELMRAE